MNPKIILLVCTVLIPYLDIVSTFNIDSDSNRIEFIDPLPNGDELNLFGFALGFFKKNDDAR